MRNRTRRFSAALIALFPLTMLLVVLTPTAAQAVTPTQNNGCLGVTGAFSQFAVPIAGVGTPNPVTAPNQITLSGTSVTISVDTALISAGITTGLVTAAPDLAHIGVDQVNSPADGGTTPNANGGISAVQVAAGKVTLKIDGTNTVEATQTATNTVATNTTFFVTSHTDGSTVVVYSSVSNPAGGLDAGRTGTVLVGSLNVPIALDGHMAGAVVTAGATTWTPTGGNVAFSEHNSAPSNLLTPTVADQTAAPLILLPKINGFISVPFHCWPGTVAAGTSQPLTPGSSIAFDTVTVNGGETTTTGSSTTTTEGSTTTTQGSTTTTTASTTTTTGPTTTLPATITATGDYAAACTNNVTPDASTLTFHITGTAPSTVVAGNPTTLSNQSWKLDVPGSVLTAGVNLGLLNPGDIVAGSITAGVFASNTKEGTQVSAAIPVSIGPISVDDITGLANDASTTFAVPDMTWTAVGGDVGYAFAESVTTVTIGPLNVIFTCEPDAAAGQFLITLVTGSTTIPPAGRGSTTTTLADQVLGDQLARTGYSPMYQVVLGLTLLDLGYLVLSAARPPRRRRIIA